MQRGNQRSAKITDLSLKNFRDKEGRAYQMEKGHKTRTSLVGLHKMKCLPQCTRPIKYIELLVLQYANPLLKLVTQTTSEI